LEKKSKNISLKRFVYALGIDHTGENAAQLIARTYSTLDNVMETSQEELKNIHGIGPETAWAVCNFFDLPENKTIIQKILDTGVVITNNQASDIDISDNPFKDKRIVLTGTLQSMTRAHAKKQLEDHGAKILSAISSKTDFLITGENPGSKLDKARKLGVKILNETDLNELNS